MNHPPLPIPLFEPPSPFFPPSSPLLTPIATLVRFILKVHVFDFYQKYNDERQLVKRQQAIKAGKSVNCRIGGVKRKDK
jgi:hypothetical protein